MCEREQPLLGRLRTEEHAEKKGAGDAQAPPARTTSSRLFPLTSAISAARIAGIMQYDLGYFDDETCRLEPIENPFGPKVLPMCSE